MCLISTISRIGAVLVCLAVGWVVLGAGGGILRFISRTFVMLLAIACIGVGVAVFSSRPNYDTVAHVEAPITITRSRDVGGDPMRQGVPIRVEPPQIRVEPTVHFERNFPFGHGGPFAHAGPFENGFPFEEHHENTATMPKWMMIALGTVLVIGGSLLFSRERTRPRALRAFTLLGLAATGFILFSLFNSPTRHPTAAQPADSVIKVSATADEPSAEVERTRTVKRQSRAERPIARAKKPIERQRTIDQLPPRAGEIPVAAELAKAEPAAPAAPAVSEPAEPEAPAAPEPAAPEPPAPEPAAPAAAESAPAAPAAAPPSPPETPKPEAPIAPAATSTDAPPAAEGRPEWVEMHGKLDGPVYRTSVASGVYVDVPECQRALEAQIKLSADRYIEDYLGPGTAALVNIPRAYLLEHVKRSEYHEIVQASVGPMHQIHALLEFDDGARAVFHDRWRSAIVTDRLWYVGSAGAVVLALLATFYGYLKLDLRTGGSHSGRLQLAATLVALIVAAGALLARWALPFYPDINLW